MARIWTKHKKVNTTLKPKVFVMMSGGVDSSVAALLLNNKGYEVVGAHLVCWDKGGDCSAGEDRADASRTASQLGVPFVTWDLREEYKRTVFDYMIKSYEQGITPNPDVECNREIKFGVFFDRAIKEGADFVATGHYVRRVEREGKFYLQEAVDRDKDQSYFLWTLTAEKIARCLFPIGEYKKSEVRKMAKEFGLLVAEKKDSQGLCFVGKINFQKFLDKYMTGESGEVRNMKGEILGKHRGVNFYTIGQRRGLGLRGGTEPYYVAEKRGESNVLLVAPEAAEELYTESVKLDEVRGEIRERVLVRVRYRQKLVRGIMERRGGGVWIKFSEPVRAVAIGQSAVWYDEEGMMLGGGVIEGVDRVCVDR